jgi:hypothetical protein
MSGRVLHFENPAHREIDALLPWYANGTLSEDECERVEAHLSGCARCQRELDWLRELRAAASEPAPVGDQVEASLERLRGRLDAGAAQRLSSPLRIAREGWRRAPRWTRWALAAQLVLCAGLAGALVASRAPAVYHTLGSGSTAGADEARLVVMFEPSMTESRLHALVQGGGARIVDGPTGTGAYVLAVPRARAGRLLATLRHDRDVQMAETLTPGRD